MNMFSIFSKRLLMHLGATFLITAALLAVIIFLGSDISSQSSAIYNKNSSLSGSLQSANDLNRLRDEAKAAASYSAKIDQITVKREGLFTFSAGVKSIAVKNNLEASFKFGLESPAESGFSRISFQITLQGNYTDIVNFVKDLEGSGYPLNLTDFSLGGQVEKYGGTIGGSIIFKP